MPLSTLTLHKSSLVGRHADISCLGKRLRGVIIDERSDQITLIPWLLRDGETFGNPVLLPRAHCIIMVGPPMSEEECTAINSFQIRPIAPFLNRSLEPDETVGMRAERPRGATW